VYAYEAEVHRVVDGDTVYFKLAARHVLTVDFGFNIIDTLELNKDAVIEFRLNGIDTPEKVGASKAKGLESQAELTRLLGLGKIRVISLKGDKYGRYLAEVFVRPEGEAEIHVNQALIDGGFAKPYSGSGPRG
jgi:endonuclease YncB( thermonuclease family)